MTLEWKTTPHPLRPLVEIDKTRPCELGKRHISLNSHALPSHYSPISIKASTIIQRSNLENQNRPPIWVVVVSNVETIGNWTRETWIQSCYGLWAVEFDFVDYFTNCEISIMMNKCQEKGVSREGKLHGKTTVCLFSFFWAYGQHNVSARSKTKKRSHAHLFPTA